MKLFLLCLISLTLVFSVFFGDSALSSSVLVETIEQDNGWGVTAVDPETAKVYITNFKSNTVTVLDGDTNKPVFEIEVGKSPYGIGINTVTKMLYVAREYANILSIVDTKSGDVVKEIELAEPYDIAVNSITNQVYVTSAKTNQVSVLDGNTNEIVATFDVGIPCGVAVNEATNMVYATSESSNSVHVFDGSTNSLVTTIDVGASPRGVVANPNTNIVYVTNQMSGTVDVIDGAKNVVVDTIRVGEAPRRIVVNPDTNLVYVSNQISNSISVIDGATNEVIDSIPVERPFELMINLKTNKLYATYSGHSLLSIVNDSAREQTPSFDYSWVGIVLAGGAAGIMAFFIVHKKKTKS